MKVFKRSKAYGALEYTLIIALIIVIAILILNFIRNRTHGVTWIDSANDKVSEYIGGSSGDPGGGTPVGSNIELYFPAAKPVFNIKEGETLTKEQIKQYITDNNGVVRNKTTLAEIGAYEIEDITYNPFDPSVYIQFKVTSLEGDAVSQIPGNILEQLADGCVLATDADFDGYANGAFYYEGSATCVKIPHVIKGINVTSYEQMFASTNVEKVISTNLNVTNMSYMFSSSQATSLDLSSLDTSNVTYMRSMFSFSNSTSLDLSNFNTSNVTEMSGMFMYSQVKFLDLSSFDTSNAIEMNNLFEGTLLTELDLSSFNTSNVTRMEYMFADSQATSITFGPSFDTSKVTDMSRMFYNSKATTLDLSSFNTEEVIEMTSMFDGSHAITLDLSSFNTEKVTDVRWMFDGSKATTGYARTIDDADKFNASKDKPLGLNFIVK